jgi:hypothetical protein
MKTIKNGDLTDKGLVKMVDNPWIDKDGNPVILKKLNNHWNIVYHDRGVKHYGQLWHEGKVFK